MKPIAQETPMGCGLACVASVTDQTFKEVLENTDLDPERSWNQGYHGKELVRMLRQAGMPYRFEEINEKNKHLTLIDKSIVFVQGEKEPFGHYLARHKDQWMDCWINHPYMNPARAGWRKDLPDKPIWIIYPIND